MSTTAQRASSPAEPLPVEALRLDVCKGGLASLLAPFFAFSPIATELRLDKTMFQLWNAQNCGFTEAVGNPFARARSRKENQDAGHLIEVTRFLSGKEQGVMNGAVIHHLPGAIYVVDQGRPMRTVASASHIQQVFVPKSSLGLSDDSLVSETVVDTAQSVGAMLHAAMDRVFAAFNRDCRSLEFDLVDGFLALLKVNLGVPPQREDVRRHVRTELFKRICAHIEQNLGDHRLSTELILTRFGASRASLYRMFEPHGGVRNYIMQRRITRATLEMATRTGERGLMRDVAERWGFSSQPNFNRSIRKMFGVNPSGLFSGAPAFTAPFDAAAPGAPGLALQAGAYA